MRDRLPPPDRIAIYAVVVAAQRAKREALLTEIAMLERSLAWYQGALDMLRLYQAKQAPFYSVPRTIRKKVAQ